MPSLWRFRWLWLYVIFGEYVRADWPLSNATGIQLLGLFSDTLNTSSPTTSAIQSRAMFKAAVVLSQRYKIKIGGELIGWQSAQTGGDAMDALSNTCRLISTSNIVGIVGPGYSREAQVIAPFAAKIGIPVISYAATDPKLSDRNTYSAFYRTVPSDNAAALSIAQLFLQYNWKSCIIIYQNDAFGSGGIKAISEAFNKNNVTVTETIIFDIATNDIRGDLKCLLTNILSRIVLVWARPDYTEKILKNALRSDVIGPQFTWILSSTISLKNFNQTVYNKLIGMLVVEPVVGNLVNAPINTTLLNKAYHLWQEHEPKSFPGVDNVDYYALFAFDAAWTLIQTLQEFCSMTINDSSSCLSFVNSSFCFDRYFLNSSSFFDIINNRTFLGVSGYVQFSPNITDRMNGTYYIVKNVQDSSNGLNYIPVLVWSKSNGWISHTQTKTIVWPGNLLSSPAGYATLSGITLRIAVYESAPFTMIKERTHNEKTTSEFIGYVPDLIEILRTKMGFIPNIILVPLNQTYNGLVDDVAKGIYDMVIADVTITARRMENVSFSSSIFDNSLRVIIRETTVTDLDLFSYLRPFSFKLWITLLLATIYAGFLICLIEGNENEALKDKSISSLIIKSMWYSIGTILGYGVDFNIRTPAGRLLTVGLYILSLVSVAAYTAKLASELTVAKTRGFISGIDDIKNGKLSFSRIGIITNTSVEDYYLREITKGSRQLYPLKSKDEMYQRLLNNTIDASIMDSGPLEYSTGEVYCNLTLVGTDFDKNAFGIVFPKKWLYQQNLDMNILSLRESGVLDKLKRKWFQTNYCSRSSTTFTAMTIESMAGLFLTFGVISILALLLFVWKKRFIIEDYLFILINQKNISKQ